MAKKKAEAEAAPRRLRITLVKSTIGYTQRQKDTVKALGLRRMHHTVEHHDTAIIRGMVNKIPHLLKVEEVE